VSAFTIAEKLGVQSPEIERAKQQVAKKSKSNGSGGSRSVNSLDLFGSAISKVVFIIIIVAGLLVLLK